MLRENIAFSSNDLANLLAQNGVRLTALENTPLGSLIEANHDLGIDSNLRMRGENDAVQNAGEELPLGAFTQALVDASRQQNQGGERVHDRAMEEVVETVSQTVKSNLYNARNVVKPQISEVVDRVQRYVDDRRKAAVSPLQIVQDIYKDIWSSPVLADMVARFDNTPPEEVGLDLHLDAPSQEQLMELVKTGSSRFDQEVNNLIEDTEEGAVIRAYNKLFGGSEPGEYSGHLQDHLNTRYSSRDEILLMHLIVRNMRESVPDGVNMALSDYRSYMADLISQTGRAVHRVLRRRREDDERNRLIVSFPTLNLEWLGKDGGQIFVNADVYKRFLDNGGEPEALFGSYITDRAMDYERLLNNTTDYANAWKRQERIYARRVHSQNLSIMMAGYRKAMSEQIEQMSDEQLVLSREGARQRLEEVLNMIPERNADDIQLHARRLVCKVFYDHTEAENILNRIDELGEQYPTMEVREIALLAAVDLVSDWVAHMFKVRKADNR